MTLITLFVIVVVADLVQDFITNDTLHYFGVHPAPLIVAGLVWIVGGLIVLAFSQLSPKQSVLYKTGFIPPNTRSSPADSAAVSPIHPRE